MALTNAHVKEILSKAGVDAENMKAAVTEIIEGHTTSIEALREERDSYKTKAEEAEKLSKQLEKAQKDLKSYQDNEGKDVFKVKYEELKADFDAYKKNISEKEVKSKKEKACRDMLKEAGIPDKRIDKILKVTDVDSIDFDDDGNVKDKDTLIDGYKTEWSDFIEVSETRGANTAKPPVNNGGTSLTKEDIMKIKDTTKRQEAWLEYLNKKG